MVLRPSIHGATRCPVEIHDITEINHDLVKKTLQRMARSGDLRKDGRGSYSIPIDPLSPVSPCPQSDPKGDKGTEGTPPLRPGDPDEPQIATEFF